MEFTFGKPRGVSDHSFILLRDLIQERTGIYYDLQNQEILTSKVAARIDACGLSSLVDYYYLLKYDDPTEEEWRHLIDTITVQETFFWREIDQIRALVDVLVPEYFAANPRYPLRIWSAACSTGEEPLTIAMALNEAGCFDRYPITIYGTDASPQAIAKAKAGVYGLRSFRILSPLLQDKYFHETKGKWQIDPGIHHRVQWNIANLMNASEVASFAMADIIFCRNVFIYFSEKSIQKVTQFFFEKMPKKSYLFVGAAESLIKLTHDFELQDISGAFVYVKR